MKTRWKVLLGLTAVLGLAVLAAVAHHHQLKTAVERYRAELKSRGEPMELEQALPPAIPLEQNSAAIFTNAVARLTTNANVLWSNAPPAMRGVAPGRAMVGWAQTQVCEQAYCGPTNAWAEIEAALSGEQAGLDGLRQLPATPVFDFSLAYREGFGNLKLNHLALAKKAAQRLCSSALASLHRGDTETAVMNILAMQSLVNGLSHDRLLISELVRIAVAQISGSATWEFLQSTSATDAQLAALQRGWANLEFIQSFEQAMTVERTGGQIELARLRNGGLETYFQSLENLGLFHHENSRWDRLKFKFNCVLWRYWWSYPDELRELQGLQATLEAARQFQTDPIFAAADGALKKRLDTLAPNPEEDTSFWFADPNKADFHHIISSSLRAFERAFDKVMKVETTRRVVVTAIALKRFQLKHGKMPEILTDLAPEFLASVPADPMDGRPLRYHLNDDGTVVLYAVGENGVDDGGDPSVTASTKSFYWQHDQARDWVWPQPATAAEIQQFTTSRARK